MNTLKTLYIFCFLLFTTLNSFGQRSITLIDEFGEDQTGLVLNYLSWDNQSFWAGLNGSTFNHALDSMLNSPFPNKIINYINWQGLKSSAKVEGNAFLDAPNGDFSKAIRTDEINYRTKDGRKWVAALKPNSEIQKDNEVIILFDPIIITTPLDIFTDFPPIIVLPPETTIIVTSLLDAFPGVPQPFLLEDLGLFDYTTLEDGYRDPWPLTRAMGALADQALENFTQNLDSYKPKLSPSVAAALNSNNVREQIRASYEVKAAVNSLLFVLMSEAILNTSDQSEGTIAIRNWAAEIYKRQNVAIAENSLQEYLKWKADPCNYPGARCPRGLSALLAAPKPPMQLISENGVNASISTGINIAGTLTIATGIVGAALTLKLLLVPAVSAAGSLVALSIGSTVTAGVSSAVFVSGPIGIIIAAVAVGILEGIAVSQAEGAQRKFEENIVQAKNEVVDIISIVNNDTSVLELAFYTLTTTPF